jgi:hypothetical protein
MGISKGAAKRKHVRRPAAQPIYEECSNAGKWITATWHWAHRVPPRVIGSKPLLFSGLKKLLYVKTSFQKGYG